MASATRSGNVRDAQGVHGSGQTVRRSMANYVRQSTGDKRTMKHEKGSVDATDSGHHESARKEKEARQQAWWEAPNNSFVN